MMRTNWEMMVSGKALTSEKNARKRAVYFRKDSFKGSR